MAMVNPDQVEFLFRAIAEEDPLFKGVTFETHIDYTRGKVYLWI